MTLQPAALIARKRDGASLTADELAAFIHAYLADDVDDAQMAALLMAGVINGFTTDEAIALTDVLVSSGEVVDLSGLTGPTVDKHSTGGVGDVTTLIVAPLLAATGCQVAKLSGRGLGHTGGTLDKLESIPGFRVDLTPQQLGAQVADIGLAIASATADLVPADKRLYALRDVTATVSSQALIASSVMSKKIAGGAEHILLDVKTGDGAFMESIEAATQLGELCVAIGNARGRKTGAVVSDMSQPLGDGVGNALEVAVAVETLQGVRHGNLRSLCVLLAARALELTGVPRDEAEASTQAALDRGEALERFRRLVVAQGGDERVVEDPWSVLPKAAVVAEWAPGKGTVQRFECRGLGELAGSLGAGRRRQADMIDPAVGLEVLARIGDELVSGQPLVRVHAATQADADKALDVLPALITVATAPQVGPPLVATEIGFKDTP